MQDKFKRPSSRLASEFKLQETSSPVTDIQEDIDPRLCGLIDGVKRGWYQADTGELLVGFQITKDDIFLDVGCGDGEQTLFGARQGAHVVFSDVDATKIEILLEKANKTIARKVEGFVSNSMPLPLPDEYATKILLMETLEHTVNPEKVLEELFRVGKPGAQYLITVPDSRSEMLQKPFANPVYFSEPNHIQIFDKENFVRLVESSGLKVERYDTWGFYWTMFMSLFWIVHQKDYLNGPVLDLIKPPLHPVLKSWTNTWAGLMKIDGSEKLLESFDQFLPKTQVVIARKS